MLENGQIDKETINKLKQISFKQEHFNSTSIFGSVASLVLAIYFYGEVFGENGNFIFPIVFFYWTHHKYIPVIVLGYSQIHLFSLEQLVV